MNLDKQGSKQGTETKQGAPVSQAAGTCHACRQPLGVMTRFFSDSRKPWCINCWLHGPTDPAGTPIPKAPDAGKLF